MPQKQAILAIVGTCTKRLGLPTPSVVATSTDNNIILLKAMLEKTGQELRSAFHWPEMVREYTFTLTTSAASYALPVDFDSILTATWWNRTRSWPLIGPLDPVEWQQYKSGLITSFPRQRFRIKGQTGTQLFIDPTPTSSENGQTIAYEYLTRSVYYPIVWIASTSWAGHSYCSYNGNTYAKTAGTSTGTTPPTHTSGAVSDGGITWTYNSTTQFEYSSDDTDLFVLDDQLMIDGAVWRFKRERGLDYEELKRDAEEQIDNAKSKLAAANALSLSNRAQFPFMIGPWSYPEGNYGV